jgi:hypothetical protein
MMKPRNLNLSAISSRAALCVVCWILGLHNLFAAPFTQSPLGGGYGLLTSNCNAYVIGSLTNKPAPTNTFTIEGYMYVPELHALMDIPGFLFYQDGFACVEVWGGGGTDAGKYFLWFGLAVEAERTFIGPVTVGFWPTLAGGWHHIACVFDATAQSKTIYLDGERALTMYQQYLTFPQSMPPAGTVSIGGAYFTVSYNWGYAWDEIRVSRNARYSAAFTPPIQAFEPDTNTFALWHFDEPPGATRFYDSSGQQNTLTSVNGSLTAPLGIYLRLSKRSSSSMQIALFGDQGSSYAVQWRTNMISGSWRSLTNLTLLDHSTNIVDSAISSYPRKFYRAVKQ